jgi:hypothetical protein
MADNLKENIRMPQRSSWARLVAIGLLALIIVVAGIYWASNRSSSNVQKGYSFHYEKSSNYILSGKGLGYGILINRPDTISQPLIESKKVKFDYINSVVFDQKQKINKTNYKAYIAYLALKSRPYPKPVLGTVEYRDTVSKFLDPKSNRYQDELINIVGFARQSNPNPLSVTLDSAQPFTNGNDYYPAQQGKVIYVLGDRGWYYIMITAEKNNWSANQAFFQKAINSIKVDQ